jgi:glycosyltransferase involved in cell wall biosynthesis
VSETSPAPATPRSPRPAAATRKRAVLLVGNPANPYSRAIRLGRTLTDEGYDVEIAATYEEGAALEQRDGPLLIRRYKPSGIYASMAATYRWSPSPTKPTRRPPLATRVLRTLRARFVAWFLWPHTVRGWWATLSRELAPADLYHSCGTLPIAAALAARDRDRRAGRRSSVVLDVIDITMESNNVLGVPPLLQRMLDRRERRWARRADAHTAVNDVFADKAVARWSLATRPTVVPNYPEPWQPPAIPPDLIRSATGLPASTRICLFWGRLGPYVGLDEAAEAVLLVPDGALVLLGFGRGWERSVARDSDPRYAGRHFTLPAVHPDDLPAWVASADVAMCTLPPLSYNQRYTLPNKFLESMTAGTPMVLGPDLPTMESLLRAEDLGRVAASMAPRDIAAAITSILATPVDERVAWRERIRTVARERYSWPIAAGAYSGVLRSLSGPP